MLKSSIGRLRLVGILEGLSWFYLLYCSIVLKRMMGDADAIKLPGPIHGALFCIYCVLLMIAKGEAKWSLKQAAWLFIASIIPGGFIFAEMWMKKEERRLREQA